MLRPFRRHGTSNFSGLLRVPRDAHGSLATRAGFVGLVGFGSAPPQRGSRDEATNVDELRHVLSSRVLLPAFTDAQAAASSCSSFQ